MSAVVSLQTSSLDAQERAQTHVSDTAVKQLLAEGRVWQAAQPQLRLQGDEVSTGLPELDQALQGGWPEGVLVELLSPQVGHGELSLVLPALQVVSNSQQHRGWIIWVDPPFVPNAKALEAEGIDLNRILVVRSSAKRDQLWCIEQVLRGGDCCAVLGWLPKANTAQLRRLQLAAADKKALVFLFRPDSAVDTSSPAPVRIHLGRTQALPPAAELKVVKRRVGWPLSLGEQPLKRENALQDEEQISFDF